MKTKITFFAGFLALCTAAFAGPYDAAWTKYRLVTVNTTTAGVTGTVTNFPLLVRLTNADAAHGSDVLTASSTGADVRFTDSTGTTALSYQIERWTASAAEIWVQVPSVAGSASTPIRMYWGNGSATSASSGAGVFDTVNGFVGVWHFGDATGIDPRPNAVAGAPAATPSNNFAGAFFGGGAGTYLIPDGMIGKADSVRGGGGSTGFGSRQTPTATCDYFNIGSAADNTTSPYTGNNTYTGYNDFTAGYTFSFWFKPEVSSIGAYQYISELANTTNGNGNIQVFRPSGLSTMRFENINGTNSGGNAITPTTQNFFGGTWSHLVVTFTGAANGAVIMYLNGAQLTISPATSTRSISNVLRTNAWLVKSNYNTDGYIQGVFDETEISKVVRSADWVKLSYQTQVSTQSAVTLGATQNVFTATVPGAPTGVTGTAGNGQVSLVWVAPSSNGGSAITAYTATSVADTSKHCSTTGGLTCTITGLTNGTAYTFTATATNVVGTSVASAASAAVTPVAPPGVPNAPTGAAATAGNGQATVTWTAAVANGSAVTGYIVTSSPDGKSCTTTGALTCVDTALANGTSYTFTVVATSAAGNSSASIPSTAVIPVGAPGAPTGLVGAAGNAQVVVTWVAPVSTGGSVITGYKAMAVSDTTKSCTTTGALTCTVTGLTNGTAYTFTVKATNAAGTSVASTASTAVTPVTVPGAPSISSVVGASGQVTVTWTAPASTGGSVITGYTVVASDTSKKCTTTGALTCAVSGLTNTTAYTFTVTATNAVGTSVASAISASVTGIFSAAKKDIGFHISGSSMILRLPEYSGSAKVSIVDIWGRTVWSKTVAAGVRDVSWQKGSSGSAIVPGLYIVRVTTQENGFKSKLAAESKIMVTP